MTELSKRLINCPDCGEIMEQKVLGCMSKVFWFPKRCQKCATKEEAEAANAAKESAQKSVLSAWEAICPPLYRESDPERINPVLIEAIGNWQLGMIPLAFVGEQGNGKTRAMFMLLKRLHFDGVNVMAVSAIRLAKVSAEQFEDDKAKRADARGVLEKAAKVAVLFIDDLGKQRFTERAEVDLFDLLETRTANLRPTFWTANANASQLRSMLSPDKGDPILRRLIEFTQIIKL